MDRSDSLDLVLFSFVIYNSEFARITPQMLLQIDDGSQCANLFFESSFFLSFFLSGALQTLIPREREEASLTGEAKGERYHESWPVHFPIGSFSLNQSQPSNHELTNGWNPHLGLLFIL
jgi:hypothetical protein